MQSADQNKDLKGREHHYSSSITAKSTTNSSALPTTFPLQTPSSLPSSSSSPSPSTTDASSPTPPISPSLQLSIEPTDYTLEATRSGSEPLVCVNFGPISLSAIDLYHLLTPGNNYSSPSSEPESRDSTMLVTIQQNRAQELLQRQVQENQLWLQTPFLHYQFHPQQLLQVMQPSSYLQPFPPPPPIQLSSSPSPSPSSLPPPLPPTTLTPPDAPLSAPHLIQYDHSHYHTHPNQQQPAALQRWTSGIEPLYQQYHHLSPQQQQSMLQQQTQQLPLQQYQNDGSYEKRGRFFPWSAPTTPMAPLSGNFGPLPLANTGTLENVLYVDPHQYQNQLNQHHQQQLAHQGRIPNKQQRTAKHNTKRAADDMITPESLRPAQRRRLGASRDLSISSEATVVALPTVALRAAPQAMAESSPRATQPPTLLSPIASKGAAKCPHCGKEFQSKGLLRSHVVSHSTERPFVCWDCADKSYKRNHDLLRHRREKHR